MGGTQFVSKSIAMQMIDNGHEVDIFTRGVQKVDYSGINRHIKGDRKSLECLQMIGDKNYDVIIDVSAYTKEDVQFLLKHVDIEKLKKYIFISSGAVYCESQEVIHEEQCRGENKNWGTYGLNKKKAEDFLFHMSEENGIPVTIFRPTYIYGKGNNLYREKYFFDRIEDGMAIPIPIKIDDNGRKNEVLTQFIYIDDMVKIIESCIGNEKSNGQAYNITHPDRVSWRKLIQTTSDVINKEAHIIEANNVALDIQDREFFPFRNVTYMLSIEKLIRDGLYVPKIELTDGLKLALEDYNRNFHACLDKRMNKIEYVIEKASTS